MSGKHPKRDRQEVPTLHRIRHSAAYMSLIAAPGGEAGAFCYEAHDTCLLDKLHADGAFDSPEDEEAATRRWDAGIRLKALHQAAGLAEPGSADLGRAPIGSGSDQGEMSDQQSRAFTTFIRIMREIGPVDRRICRDIACYDVQPKWAMPQQVCMALDRLFRVMG